MKNTYKCEMSSIDSTKFYTINLSCFSREDLFNYLSSLERNGKIKVISVEKFNDKLIKWSGFLLRMLLLNNLKENNGN